MLCLCLYTSSRIKGTESRAMMQAAVARTADTVPGETDTTRAGYMHR